VAADAWVGSAGLASSREALPPTWEFASRTRTFAFGLYRFAQNAADSPERPPPTTIRS
jgi:hypothetical protein